MKLTPEDQLILWSVKIQPSSEELKKIDILLAQISDWDYLIKTIVDRGIAPLLYTKLPKLSNANLLPKAAATKLQQAYLITFSRSTVLYEHFRMVANAFAKFNIPIIALKGVYLSENLYQDIGLRQFSDIDLLVKPEDGTKAIAVLSDMGYVPAHDKRSKFIVKKLEFVHFLPMVFRGVSIEIHIKLHRTSEKYNLKIEEVWENCIPANINSKNVFTLCDNDLLIYLCLHLDKHFRDGKVQFTCFNDITNFIENNADQFDWGNFIERCKYYNCEKIVLVYIVLVQRFMNASVPDVFVSKYKHLLTKQDEKLFLKYLTGHKSYGSSSTVVAHVKNLKLLGSFSDRARFVLENIFPSIDFMISKYNIKNKKFVLFYYPYRYFIGLRGIFNHLFKIK